MILKASEHSKLVSFASGTLAFTVTDGDPRTGNPVVSTRHTSIHNVWSWYETALDIASLPTSVRNSYKRGN